MAQIINLSRERNDPTPENVAAMLSETADHVKGQGSFGPSGAFVVLDYPDAVDDGDGRGAYSYRFLNSGMDIDRIVRLFEQIKLDLLTRS